MEYKITEEKSFIKDEYNSLKLINKKTGKSTYIGETNRPIYVHVDDNKKYNKNNLEEGVKKGDIIKFTPNDILKIGTTLGCFKKIDDDDLLNAIEYFEASEWYFKHLKEYFDEEEEKIFRNWEEKVGYEEQEFMGLTFKHYNEDEKRGLLEVVKNSPRLLNLMKKFIGDSFLKPEYFENYLIAYSEREKIQEVLHFDETNVEKIDELAEKYGIDTTKKGEVIQMPGISLSNRRNGVTMWEGEKYNIYIHSQAGIDTFNGIMVIANNDIKFNAIEVISMIFTIEEIESGIEFTDNLINLKKWW